MRRRDREHGGVLPLLLGMLLILAVAFFGATTIGRFVVARQEAQRAADATCLAYGTIIRTEGMQVLSEQQRRAEVVGRANTTLTVLFDWSVPPLETATAVELTCRAIARVPAPSFGAMVLVSAICERSYTALRHEDGGTRSQVFTV